MDVLSQFWSPLCAVGSHGPEGANAQICVSVFGASIVPDRPRLLVCLHKTNYTWELVQATGTLAITVLADGQEDLLTRLGLVSGRDEDKLRGLGVKRTANGDPVFPGGAGMVEGEVLQEFDFGDATGFLVAVRGRETWDREPMRWHAVRERLGEEFTRRWATKQAREQELARTAMTWKEPS